MAARPHLVIHQDTFDLRDQIHPDDHNNIQQGVIEAVYHSDEEHSVLEDDSDGEDRDDYMDDDGSSSLSIPNESIDFDLVYALHSFAATVEGQANVVKGDSLFLMDDSNSYWWLVRVLKTQEVGYIPAENIETPFERLARLNKHRNIDVRLHETWYLRISDHYTACVRHTSGDARCSGPRKLSRTLTSKYRSSDYSFPSTRPAWNFPSCCTQVCRLHAFDERLSIPPCRLE